MSEVRRSRVVLSLLTLFVFLVALAVSLIRMRNEAESEARRKEYLKVAIAIKALEEWVSWPTAMREDGPSYPMTHPASASE